MTKKVDFSNILRNKRALLMVSISLAIIAFSFAIFYYISNNYNEANIADNNGVKVLTDAAAHAEEVNKVTKEAEDILRDANSVEEAIKIYDSAIESSEDDYQKNSFSLAKAVFYFNNGMPDKALEIALGLYEVGQSENLARFIAEIYSQLENNEKAIEYYNEAILMADTSEEQGAGSIDYYKAEIESLAG